MLIWEYLRSLHARKSPATTQATVRSVLSIVETYTGKHLEHCGPTDLLVWQSRRADELSSRSLRTQVGVVRACYRWAVDDGRLREDPSARLRSPPAHPGGSAPGRLRGRR
jgi:site-specific recombinase XerC